MPEHSLRRQIALSSSLTGDSLDLRQLLASDCVLEPLISESVSFATLSSSSSDQVPPFSTYKLPTISIIGLGDHLKMFSEPPSRLQERRTDVNPKVIITSPTSPRLKSMYKECLCISKWAECLTGWRAPGHIPWGNIPDQTTTGSEKWLPEGSLYSPEDFSCALHQARAGCARTQTEQGSVDTSLNRHTTTTDRMEFESSSGTLTHMEFLDMMQELKDLKAFLEDTSPQVSKIVQPPEYPEQLTLPCLMVSNSHCTFPLSLDSCQSFTPVKLADRRGRKPPPPLLLKNERTSPELSYPGIPTAFLDSPSTKFRDVHHSNTSGLRIEDMINNLRLQCSSMALPTQSGIENTDQPNNISSGSDILCRRLARRQKRTSLSRVRIANPEMAARTDICDKKPEVCAPLLFRSSLAKYATFQSRSPKSVRFALSPSEFEKDVASLMSDSNNVWQISTQNHLYDNALIKENSIPTESDKESSDLIRQNTQSRHSKVSSTKPLRHGNTNTRNDNHHPRRSLGRHSLSRISTILSGKGAKDDQKKSRLRNILTRFR